MSTIVVPHGLHEALHKHGPFWPGSHNAHVSFENVEKLRQFIETGLSKNPTEAGAAWIVSNRPAGITFHPGRNPHGPEFVHAEQSAIQANALLNEENRPWRSDSNEQGYDSENGGAQQQNRAGQNQIERALEDDIERRLCIRRLKIKHQKSANGE